MWLVHWGHTRNTEQHPSPLLSPMNECFLVTPGQSESGFLIFRYICLNVIYTICLKPLLIGLLVLEVKWKWTSDLGTTVCFIDLWGLYTCEGVSVYKEVTVHMNKLHPKGHAPSYVMLTAIILTTMLTAVQMDEIAWEKTPIDEEASIHNTPPRSNLLWDQCSCKLGFL